VFCSATALLPGDRHFPDWQFAGPGLHAAEYLSKIVSFFEEHSHVSLSHI
jgi:hypothetical protein